jgi:hypothetical protein
VPDYLTPGRYRTLGSGVRLGGVSDTELLSHIQTASALVNGYTCQPSGYDFRGGAVVGEPHEWDLGNDYRAPSNRVYPFCRPIRTVSKLDIEVTKNQKISFANPDSLYVQEVEGYVEPVDLALTTFGVFGYGVLPNIGLRRPVARVDYEYGWLFDVTDEPVATVSGGLRTGDQFLTDEEFILKKNGTEVDPDDYTLDRREGFITLEGGDPDPGDVYLATYQYPLDRAIARATGLVVTELVGAANVARVGLTGLASIKVEEVELRRLQSRSAGGTAIDYIAPAKTLLDRFIVRSIA